MCQTSIQLSITLLNAIWKKVLVPSCIELLHMWTSEDKIAYLLIITFRSGPPVRKFPLTLARKIKGSYLAQMIWLLYGLCLQICSCEIDYCAHEFILIYSHFQTCNASSVRTRLPLFCFLLTTFSVETDFLFFALCYFIMWCASQLRNSIQILHWGTDEFQEKVTIINHPCPKHNSKWIAHRSFLVY